MSLSDSKRASRVEWKRVLSVKERIFYQQKCTDQNNNKTNIDSYSESVFSRWKKQSPFDIPENFQRKLIHSGISEENFKSVLNPNFLDNAESSRWRQELASILELKTVDRNPEKKSAGFSAFLDRFVLYGQEKLKKKLSSISNLGCLGLSYTEAVNMAQQHLFQSLYSISCRILILELNISRLKGELGSDTPEKRFDEFARQISSTEKTEQLLEEYPVLARGLIDAISSWAVFWSELLERTCSDFAELRNHFRAGIELGKLSAINTGAGDTHAGGKSVAILSFDSGFCIVYKPRSLAMDLAFGNFVSWLNDTQECPDLKIVQVLDKKVYGWMEYIDHQSCDTNVQIGLYYERLGALLAVLLTLEATDMHLENLIAHGEYPCVIDLESLFHPRLPSNTADAVLPTMKLGWEELNKSVMRIGLLPSRHFIESVEGGIEMSGISGAKGQLSPDEQPVPVQSGTDIMHVDMRRMHMSGGRNLAALNGNDVRPEEYINSIAKGFKDTYLALLNHRKELLGSNSPIEQFISVPMRVVLRNTRTYAILLRDSWHPDLMRDAIERERHFNHLWLSMDAQKWMNPAIEHEIYDLLNNDIPIFTGVTNSRSIHSSNNDKIENIFASSPYENVIERIHNMSDDDCQRQSWYINAAFVSLTKTEAHSLALKNVNALAKKEISTFDTLNSMFQNGDAIEYSSIIGRRLTNQSIQKGSDIAWLGLSLQQDKYWTLQPLGDDLYGGRTGIALFLIYLDKLTNDRKAKAAAEKIVTSIVKESNRYKTDDEILEHKELRLFAAREIGAFRSLGGSIYLLAHAASCWKRPDLIECAERILLFANQLVSDDDTLDLIGGSAGLIMAAAAVADCSGSHIPQSVILNCAERLIRKAELNGDSCSWNTSIPKHRNLTGMSHGCSGFALALFTAERITGNTNYRDAAIAALKYERECLESTNNHFWPDYRDLGLSSSSSQNEMTAWCHGSPGIGLLRAKLLSRETDKELRSLLYQDLDIAIKRTEYFGYEGSHSLCHGSIGNAELVLQAADLLGRRSLKARADKLKSNLIASIERRGAICGIPNGVEVPGLMMGMAGIGYGLLRLNNKNRVPDVLCLEPPLDRIK